MMRLQLAYKENKMKQMKLCETIAPFFHVLLFILVFSRNVVDFVVVVFESKINKLKPRFD
jgi:hypothetical protein